MPTIELLLSLTQHQQEGRERRKRARRVALVQEEGRRPPPAKATTAPAITIPITPGPTLRVPQPRGPPLALPTITAPGGDETTAAAVQPTASTTGFGARRYFPDAGSGSRFAPIGFSNGAGTSSVGSRETTSIGIRGSDIPPTTGSLARWHPLARTRVQC